MPALIHDIQGHVLRIQVRLFACRERLQAHTDTEALHDLRIALRQLRSLLRPLTDVACCAELQQRAAELGRVTGPLRDLEVLHAHLRLRGLHEAAQAREPMLLRGYALLLRSPALHNMLCALDQWPWQWQAAASAGELSALPRLIRKRLRKDHSRLAQALMDPAHDRHRLRLLVKRLRYAAETYPALSSVPGAEMQVLKQVQSALGDWHDHWQWLLRAEAESDLQPCVASWRVALQVAQAEADQALQVLGGRLRLPVE